MKNIFVSSTFLDMQAERDTIRQKVFPSINREAVSHNDYVEFNDLRWGIDTLNQNEQEATIKILNVCLNELYRSDDLMIILLGERYGWIPDSNYMEQLQLNCDSTQEKDQMSATAFEIEHGVLSGNKRALVYIRKFSDSCRIGIPDKYFEQDVENRKRLERLRERLQNNPNCKIQVYHVHFMEGKIIESDLDALAERMVEDLKDAFAQEWKDFERLSDFDREQEIQWGYINRKAKSFCARKGELDNLIKNIQSCSLEFLPKNQIMCREEHIHFIVGQSGSGKSTIISELALKLRQRGWDVLPFIGGLTTKSGDAMRVLQSIIYYIEEQLELEHELKFSGEEVYEEIEEINKCNNQVNTLMEDLVRQRLQERLLEIAGQYTQNHDPLIVVIDALDQFYPDENRDDWVFCPCGLEGNIRFLITCTPDIRTGVASKTILDKLNEEEQSLIVQGSLSRRRKEISKLVISSVLNKEGAKNPLYISMVVDRLMLMDQEDFRLIQKKGGQSDAIVSYQNDIIESLPDGLSEMAVALFNVAGKKIGQSFTQKALQYIAISRQGLRESDLAYCMENEWDPVVFSNLLHFLDDQFQMHADGRIDFMHKSIRQGVLSTIENPRTLHLKLVWCYHKRNIEDLVRASELLYHCYCQNEYEYAADVVKPIVYQNFSKDKDILVIISRLYAQTVADLALSDRGDWIQKWLHTLVEAARKSKDNNLVDEKDKWDVLWTVLWFLNGFVLDVLPKTQAGYETGGSIIKYMIEITDNAENGTLSERDREYFNSIVLRRKSVYLSKAGHEWEARIEKKRIFEATRKNFESQAEKDYHSWRQMVEDSYYLLYSMKSSSDRNVLMSALEPAAYGVSLFSERKFVDEYLNDETCLIGMFYGCIGEVCQNLYNFSANLVAYEQDLRYREEIYRRAKSAETLFYYSGGYHNIAVVYMNLDIDDESHFQNIYSSQSIFFKNTKHPLKLLPFIRFTSETEKTEGEKFMDHCHKEPPIIACLLSKNKEIELLDKISEMVSDSEWDRFSLSSGGLATWYRYWSYCIVYFNRLRYWDPSDARQQDYFCSKNISIALKRLCKALRYSWERFFNDPTRENVLTIIQVESTFFDIRKFIDIERADIFRIFDQCIQKGEEFLKICIEQDSERYNAEKKIEMQNTEYARFIFVYSCTFSAKVVLSISCSKQEEKMALHWCDMMEVYMSELNLWLNKYSKKFIGKLKQCNTSTKSNTQSKFDRYILSWHRDYEQLQRFIKRRQLRSYSAVKWEGQLQYEILNIPKQSNPGISKVSLDTTQTSQDITRDSITPNAKCSKEVLYNGKGWYKGSWKNGLRDGFGEARFPQVVVNIKVSGRRENQMVTALKQIIWGTYIVEFSRMEI